MARTVSRLSQASRQPAAGTTTGAPVAPESRPCHCCATGSELSKVGAAATVVRRGAVVINSIRYL
jgi:hypothetical protein